MQVNERTLLLPKQQAIHPISQNPSRQDDDCCICLDSQVFGRTVKICKNNHRIHAVCLETLIRGWLNDRTIESSRYNRGCPLCREPLLLPQYVKDALESDDEVSDYEVELRCCCTREECCNRETCLKTLITLPLITGCGVGAGFCVAAEVPIIVKIWAVMLGSMCVIGVPCNIGGLRLPSRWTHNSGAGGGVITEQPRSSGSQADLSRHLT